MNGYYICLDGLDTSGKSVQAKLLCASLEASGWESHLTREPGGTPSAELIRDLLVNGEPDRFGDMTETLLFAAARSEMLRTFVRPLLSQGKVVVSDRGFGSALAYQPANGQVSRQQVLAIHNTTTGGLRPDLTILLDIPADVAMDRARRRAADSGVPVSRFEKKGLGYFERVRDGFLQTSKSEPNWVRIDAMQTIDAVHQMVVNAVHDRLAISREKGVTEVA